MQFQKVSCSRCAQYQNCPQRTRMFVNYCGSDRKRVESLIKEAVMECRARKGHLFTRGFLLQIQSGLIPKPVNLSYTS
ncbi:MAG: hypothetical protein GX089_04190 [Fibrobacter sp.]|jgi:hypothetical protein|nr:hypothetical protein [Fibrobacter sp.]HON10732.1 hypothetical protein [Chitinispirillaceae bacterium]